MPAWTPSADGCFPTGFIFLWGLPEGKVSGAVLGVFVSFHGMSSLKLVRIKTGKPAIVGKSGNAEVNGAVLLISQALLKQPFHQLCHLRNVIGGIHQFFR